VIVDEAGRTMVRQAMVTDDERLVFFDMTPTEIESLVTDLEKAREYAVNGPWATTATAEYPADRF
jgi:hypothetical protein